MCTRARGVHERPGVCTSAPGVHELGRYGAPVTQHVRFRLDDDAAAAVDALRARAATAGLLRAAGAARPHRGRGRRDPTRRPHGARRRVASARSADRLAGHARQHGGPAARARAGRCRRQRAARRPQRGPRRPRGAGARARSPRTCRAPGCRTAYWPRPSRPRRSSRCTRWSRCGHRSWASRSPMPVRARSSRSTDALAHRTRGGAQVETGCRSTCVRWRPGRTAAPGRD